MSPEALMPQGVGLALVALNLLTFAVYALDKKRAREGKFRVPEGRLLFLAAIGGSVGALLAMRICHHKTRKPRFRFGVPLMLLLQVVLAAFLLQERFGLLGAGFSLERLLSFLKSLW